MLTLCRKATSLIPLHPRCHRPLVTQHPKLPQVLTHHSLLGPSHAGRPQSCTHRSVSGQSATGPVRLGGTVQGSCKIWSDSLTMRKCKNFSSGVEAKGKRWAKLRTTPPKAGCLTTPTLCKCHTPQLLPIPQSPGWMLIQLISHAHAALLLERQ